MGIFSKDPLEKSSEELKEEVILTPVSLEEYNNAIKVINSALVHGQLGISYNEKLVFGVCYKIHDYNRMQQSHFDNFTGGYNPVEYFTYQGITELNSINFKSMEQLKIEEDERIRIKAEDIRKLIDAKSKELAELVSKNRN